MVNDQISIMIMRMVNIFGLVRILESSKFNTNPKVHFANFIHATVAFMPARGREALGLFICQTPIAL